MKKYSISFIIAVVFGMLWIWNALAEAELQIDADNNEVYLMSWDNKITLGYFDNTNQIEKVLYFTNSEEYIINGWMNISFEDRKKLDWRPDCPHHLLCACLRSGRIWPCLWRWAEFHHAW